MTTNLPVVLDDVAEVGGDPLVQIHGGRGAHGNDDVAEVSELL